MTQAEKARDKLNKTIQLLASQNLTHSYREEIKLATEFCDSLEKKDYKTAGVIKDKLLKILGFRKHNIDFF